MSAQVTDNLPLLAGAPNGIKKLRELILELAVRGKLVPQDPNDEPASELLKRIAEEKARLVAEGKIKKPKQQPKTTEDDISFVLPNGWDIERLGVTSHLITKGTTPTTLGHAYTSSGISFVKVENIESRRILKTAISQFISPETDELMSRSRLEAGDVLFSIAGTIGKTCSIQKEDLPANTNQALAIIRGTSTVFLQDFLLSQLDSFVSEKTKERARGGAMPNVSLGDLSDLVLVIPPLAEQYRIVAKVDELMALCDRLEAKQADAESAHAQLVQALLDSLTQAADGDDFAQSWQRLAEHFHTLFTTESSIGALKQTLLQLAVMGKLVPQDPNDEPASELLKRIAEEKARLVAEGKLKKQKPLAAITEADQLFPLPNGWVFSRIGELALSTEYGLSEKTADLKEGIPVLKMGDIQEGQVLLGGQMKVTTNVEGLPELYLQPEDLLYNRTNSAELVGKTGIYLGSPDEYTFASYLIRIRCLKELFSPKYLNISMNTPVFRETQISPHLKQQCGQANVNGTIMKNMVVSAPPIAEQHRIVAKVDQLMALCDQLKQRLSQARTLHEQLANTLVEQAVA